MKKLILLSIIFASIAIPARAAKLPDARAGLKKALLQTALFSLLYVVLVTQVWTRL